MEKTKTQKQADLTDLNKLLKENKDFIKYIVDKYTKVSKQRLMKDAIIIVLILLITGILTFTGNITSDTLAGLIGVIIGYFLSRN